jgi:hypothetical protein
MEMRRAAQILLQRRLESVAVPTLAVQWRLLGPSAARKLDTLRPSHVRRATAHQRREWVASR